MRNSITIVSRKSKLALWQANWVKEKLSILHPGLTFSISAVVSTGDRLNHQPIESIGGKNVFIKELQSDLLAKQADIAVHCIKDMSVFPTEGLTTSCIPSRAEANDTLICREPNTLESLPVGAKIGTGSPRRACLIKNVRPDINICPIRGNIDTRLQKLDNGQYDAIILAKAGLKRLNLHHRIHQNLDHTNFTPAIGQGALGLEHRSKDDYIQQLISKLHDPETAACVLAEQTVNQILEGDCHSCIGAYATINGDLMRLSAMVGSPHNNEIIRVNLEGHKDSAIATATQAAHDLIAKGALQLLNT